MRFDPTELETPLRELLHANDEWTYVEEKEGKERSMANVKTSDEMESGRMVREKELRGNQAAFVRKRMLDGDGDSTDRFAKATHEMHDGWPSYTQKVDLVKRIAHRGGEIRPKREDGMITWGRKIPSETAKSGN